MVAAVSGSALFAILLATASTTFTVTCEPKVNAARPTLVNEDELASANSIVTTIAVVCIALGLYRIDGQLFLRSVSEGLGVSSNLAQMMTARLAASRPRGRGKRRTKPAA